MVQAASECGGSFGYAPVTTTALIPTRYHMALSDAVVHTLRASNGPQAR